MISHKKVRGTQKNILERELNVDTVYLRSNIHQIEDKYGHKIWEYDEQQMNFEEYFKLVVPKNEDTLNAAIIELSSLLANYKEEIDREIAILKEGGTTV